MKFLSLTTGIYLLILNCNGQRSFDYNFNKPDIRHELPAILNEVSGLTEIDSSHVACVQDELGIVFIYNFISGKIVSQHEFEATGDFEGVAYTGDAIFILRSDGRLTEWADFRSDSASIRHYELPLLTADNEGLCYDGKHNRILIAAKSKPRKRYGKTERLIYSFDLSQNKLIENPLFSLDTELLAASILDFDLQGYSITKKGEIKGFNFRPAGLAIHPLSDDIYIISATDNLLVVMDREGGILHMKQLDPEHFTQPEGITFLQDGTMFITSEAAGAVATLAGYKMITN